MTVSEIVEPTSTGAVTAVPEISVANFEPNKIPFGTSIVLYINPSEMLVIDLQKDASFVSKYGKFLHNDIAKVSFGHKIYSQSGFYHVLKLTPQLWTSCLPHRTQILYEPDIAFITAKLGVKVGDCVVESGTGSGSFSHSLSKTIGSTGKLLTFEYHQERSEKARIEFQKHGLNNVTVSHVDVCEHGFGENLADSIFLDLPSPWLAIPHCRRAFKKNIVGVVCCFSPCIEQVIKSVDALEKAGAVDIKMFEVLGLGHDVKQIQLRDVNEPAVKLQKRKFQEADEEMKADKVEAKYTTVSKIMHRIRSHTSYLTFANFEYDEEEVVDAKEE